MKYTVEITPIAESEIEEAYCYIRNDSPQNAENWRKKLYTTAETLSRFPEGCSFALENELVNFEVRQTFHGRYRILFTIHDNRVIVLHGRQTGSGFSASETRWSPYADGFPQIERRRSSSCRS